MADWLEHYASIQDVVVWTSTELRTRPSYDPAVADPGVGDAGAVWWEQSWRSPSQQQFHCVS